MKAKNPDRQFYLEAFGNFELELAEGVFKTAEIDRPEKEERTDCGRAIF
jgi:hypothetical protein